MFGDIYHGKRDRFLQKLLQTQTLPVHLQSDRKSDRKAHHTNRSYQYTNLQVSTDSPEDVVDAVSGQQGHKHVLQRHREEGVFLRMKRFSNLVVNILF